MPALLETRRSRIVFAVSLLVPLTLYVLLAWRLIAAGVGYEMDEALYTESAVFLLAGGGAPPFVHEPASWIPIGGRSWPLMIIPYVGAVKAYVTLPLFAVFGIGPEVARLSGVLLGCVGIAGLVTLIGRRISAIAGLIVGLLLAIHPTYLDFTVFDNGGVAVWMAAMGLLALALTNHLRRASTLSAFWIGLAAGLGIWARVNVAWLLASAAVAALFSFGWRALVPKRHLAAMFAGACLGAAPLIRYEIASRLGTLRFMSDTRQPLTGHLILQRFRALAEVMISDREQRVIWGGPPIPVWEAGAGAALLALVLVCVFAPIGAHKETVARWRRAFAVTTVVLAAILAFSRLGIQQHHAAAVVPLAFAALALFAVELAERSRRAILPMGALAAGLVILSLSWDARIDRGLRATGGNGAFSSAIDDAGRFLESNPVPPDRLKILHWGLQNNLYVVSRGQVHGQELYWGATKQLSRSGKSWDAEIRDGGSFLLFVSPMGPPAISDGAAGFSSALEAYAGPRRERIFRGRSGSPIVRLIEIPAAR